MKRPARRPAKPKLKTSVELCEENYAQLRRIADVYHLTQTAVVAQSIARWYHTDPVVKEKLDVADHS